MRGCGMAEEEIASIVGTARGRPPLAIKPCDRHSGPSSTARAAACEE
jgi:hypothetical protein